MKTKKLFFLGDLNCDFLKKNPATSHMSLFINMYNLDQLVTKPTRITPNSKTLIDVVLSTDCNICVDTDVVHHSFSDHSLVHTTVLSNLNKKGSKNVNHVTKTFRSFKVCGMGRSDKVSLWYVALLINTRFRFFILE